METTAVISSWQDIYLVENYEGIYDTEVGIWSVATSRGTWPPPREEGSCPGVARRAPVDYT